MEIRDLVSAHLPDAVIAAVIFTLYNIYTVEVVGPLTVGIDFALHVVVIFIGFVVINAIWDRAFGRGAT